MKTAASADSHARGPKATSDQVLEKALWGFAFIAMVFEPLVYFGCLSADGVSVAADWRISHCPDGAINSLWRTYISWDPLFIRVPPFLRIMCSIEVFVFGPSYALMALALRQPAPPRWFPGFALAFSGALLYSTAVFFTYEVLFAPRDFVNLPMVCLVNAPWSLLPLALGTRALELIRAAQLLGPTSPRGIIGCFNSDKWS